MLLQYVCVYVCQVQVMEIKLGLNVKGLLEGKEVGWFTKGLMGGKELLV